MGIFTIRVPDVGEGIAEAELVEWTVGVGDVVREDDVFASVMTDKATVEIPSSVEGVVTWLGAEVGETVAIGSKLIQIEVKGEGNEKETTAEEPAPSSEQTAPVPAPAKNQ